MAVLGLVLVIVWVVLVAGIRGAARYRSTGAVGLRYADRRGSPQWWARVVSSLGFLCAILAPIAELAGLPPFEALDDVIADIAGTVLVGVGIAITLVSQAAMGASWRGDVDPDARTALVTDGPFRVVRNPILTGTITTALGLALVTPNILSLLMLVAILVSLEIQVRLVEEPYLLAVHGAAYRAYAARTGRFVPGIGRLRSRA